MTTRRESPHATGRDLDRAGRSVAAEPCAPARMGRDGACGGAQGAIYNEIDAYPAEWLRNLIAAGHIAPGVVDERSIADVRATDLAGAVQFHTFAGIGVWSHALRLAGWPDDRPVWTGSCPCQPFSAAGKGAGFDDARHLWPEWFRLIRECRPSVVFGEQVASGDGLAWLDLVQADLEGAGYAVAAFDLCAAGFGAPHIRQRLYFCAYRLADGDLLEGRLLVSERGPQREDGETRGRGEASGMADNACNGRQERRDSRGGYGPGSVDDRAPRRMVDPNEQSTGRDRRAASRAEAPGECGRLDDGSLGHVADAPGDGGMPVNGFWRDAEWIPCQDPQRGVVYRAAEPGTFPLAHGATQRVGRLRAFGNSLVAPQAAAFIRAVMDVLDIDRARALATWDASAVACGWRGEVP